MKMKTEVVLERNYDMDVGKVFYRVLSLVNRTRPDINHTLTEKQVQELIIECAREDGKVRIIRSNNQPAL